MNDRERLWNYYAAGRLGLPRPRYLCVNASLRCDGRCVHCGIWREGGSAVELTAGELRAVLRQPFFREVETAWLTGGEPTLREDFSELALVLAESLPALQSLGLATNGLEPDRVLMRVKSMQEAIGPGPRGLFIHLSLDGVGEVHDRARGRSGAFTAVTETIDRLLALAREQPEPRLELGLNCVIQPGNLAGLDELRALAAVRGLTLTFNVVLVTDQIYRNLASAGTLGFSEEQKRELAAFFERLIPHSPAPLGYQYRIIREVLLGRARPRRCLTLYTTVNINADGTLIPCPAASDVFPHRVTEVDLQALWQTREAAEMRERVRREFCPTCMLSCSLGDSMPVGEWLKGGWEGEPGPGRRVLARVARVLGGGDDRPRG